MVDFVFLFQAAKRNIYADEKDKENMDDWDEDQLADVINKKHGSEKSNKTDIVSSLKSTRLHLCPFMKAGSSVVTSPNSGHCTFIQKHLALCPCLTY